MEKVRGPNVSALKGGQLPHRDTKPKQRVAFAVDASAAATPDDDMAAAADHTSGTGAATAKDQQQQSRPQQQHLQRLSPSVVPQQWTRLTAGTLRRLAVDSRSISGTSQAQSCPSSTSHRSRDAQSQRVAIPLMIQPPGADRSGSFVNAAVPTDSLAFEAAGVQLDEPDADGAEVAGDAGVAKTATHRYGSDGGSSSSAAPGSEFSIGNGSISSILAAANTQRDYEVGATVLKAVRLRRSGM
jgi:hypothetical protein